MLLLTSRLLNIERKKNIRWENLIVKDNFDFGKVLNKQSWVLMESHRSGLLRGVKIWKLIGLENRQLLTILIDIYFMIGGVIWEHFAGAPIAWWKVGSTSESRWVSTLSSKICKSRVSSPRLIWSREGIHKQICKISVVPNPYNSPDHQYDLAP